MARILLFNKPYGVLPQFTDKANADSPRPTLSNYISEKGVYPAGRLDKDSEGLMILTDNGKLQNKISSPRFKTPKTYWVQVEGDPSEADLEPLRKGVQLNDGLSKPARASLLDVPSGLWERDPPIRVRKSVPDRWISVTIIEGRNRQVRRMTAAIGFPTLRLIRHSIGTWELGTLQPGDWKLL